MRRNCSLYRSAFCRVGAALVAAVIASPALAQEQPSVQKLLERGALEQALQRAESERDNHESTFLSAQASIKMSNQGRAGEDYRRLREHGEEGWKAIGESGALMLEGNLDGAMGAAERATAVSGENPYAHYQLGLVANRRNQFDRALTAFGRAAELKPDLAYAHYFAGTASQRMKQIARMSEHFEIFLKLAPDAPERNAVAAILRTLRGRG